jgi:hypothetical protein
MLNTQTQTNKGSRLHGKFKSPFGWLLSAYTDVYDSFIVREKYCVRSRNKSRIDQPNKL